MEIDHKERVLILCTGNACRSQMAEGLLRHMAGDRFAVYSAGSDPAGYVHPLAVRAMAEIGIDISHQQSKSMYQFLGQPFDVVLTVCDHANEVCPFFPGDYRRVHRDFYDPGRASGTEEERMAVFRRVRDEIRDWLRELFNL
jgi:arsenate reductase